MIRLSSCFIALLLALSSTGLPAPQNGASTTSTTEEGSGASTSSSTSTSGTSTGTVAAPQATRPTISLDPNNPVWDSTSKGPFDSIRGDLGATIIGPNNPNIAVQNPDLLAPPTTDSGSVPNIKWPMSLSHNRLSSGGWAREQNANVMPIATAMAGVNMRLKPGAIRELHWHKTAEWAYVIKGTTQVTSVDAEGRNFISTVGPGDLWYFPPGIPHSLQATGDDPDGSEFLLVFPDGMFSEDSTFLLTEWLAHVPAEVLAKNFQTDINDFKDVPASQLYIFPADVPADDQQAPVSPFGTVPDPFSFALSNVTATQFSGGSVKIVDSSTFKVSVTIAAAEVTVEPGAMRELHWHPTQDEWGFFLEGEGRISVFASESNARTFDFQAGDVSYVPATFGHYVENTGNTTLKFLEIFNSPKFQDVSLNQWLALTPPSLVKAHLGFSDETIAKLKKDKPVVVGPAN
ncbi:oxalate decarboxylase [Ephemerocybe angulata]|uniref:Oxalate decarboxylase n=1 Tax=Ephemerocybe angulata TaxID=980116 RepID=A0A8H6I133_9AGAR|nr:oxalate decarboxylase [Tulosesus angulatus]